MKTLECLGAAAEVTGSAAAVTDHRGRQVMVDFGRFQGPGYNNGDNQRLFNVDTKKLDAVVVTHGHGDHSGELMRLYREGGYEGPVYMTRSTAAILYPMLSDAAKISASERRQVPYKARDVDRVMKNVVVVSYDKQFPVGDCFATLKDAAHILGSASVELTRGGQKIVFSGDLGNASDRLLKPGQLLGQADLAVMESTYGGARHSKEDPVSVIRDMINRVTKRGPLLIPAFALHRTQTILNTIRGLKQSGEISSGLPVSLDGPLAARITRVYQDFLGQGFFNESIEGCQHPFSFSGLEVVESGQDSQGLAQEPGVIIAGSGMMEGGKAPEHAKWILPNRYAGVLFTGYQVRGTLGRQIVDGAEVVRIGDRCVSVHAKIKQVCLSSHPDSEGLLERWGGNSQKVVLVHGEDSQRKALAEEIGKRIGRENVILPSRHQQIMLS